MGGVSILQIGCLYSWSHRDAAIAAYHREIMKTSGTGRVLAVLFIGIIGGIYLHFRQSRWIAEGRVAFLADQGKRFDSIMTHNAATPIMLVVGVILAALGYGVYELVAAGFTRVIPPAEIEE
jgi:hypothetical protein